MGEHDDDDEVDRAAILARRQRFIAMAISSLAMSCGDDGSPQPCLDIAMPTSTGDDGMTGNTAGMTGNMSSSASTGMPMPCLDVAPQTSSDGTDGTGSVGGSGSSSSSGGTADDTGGTTGDPTGGASDDATSMPMPCLGVHIDEPDPDHELRDRPR